MNKKKGIVLAEAVAGIILLIFFIIFSMGMFLNAARNLKETKALSNAITLLVNETEKLKVMEYRDVTASNQTVSMYNITRTVNVLEPFIKTVSEIPVQVNCKEVTIKVEYELKGKEESISWTTLKMDDR